MFAPPLHSAEAQVLGMGIYGDLMAFFLLNLSLKDADF